jgi:hypothetical protein
MGREINRVPMDFAFPIGESYADAMWLQHKATCPHSGEPEFDHDDDTCGGYSICPPEGEGWQLWQTVSDGPISPVFATADELIDWMCQPDLDRVRPFDTGPYPDMPWAQGWKRETAERFVRGPGWMPSAMAVGGKMLTTDEMAAELTKAK